MCSARTARRTPGGGHGRSAYDEASARLVEHGIQSEISVDMVRRLLANVRRLR